MSGHDEQSPLFHVGRLEEPHHCASHFRRSVFHIGIRRRPTTEQALPSRGAVAMDHSGDAGISFVNRGVRERLRRRDRLTGAVQPVPLEIVLDDLGKLLWRELREAAGARPCDEKPIRPANPHTEVANQSRPEGG